MRYRGAPQVALRWASSAAQELCAAEERSDVEEACAAEESGASKDSRSQWATEEICAARESGALLRSSA